MRTRARLDGSRREGGRRRRRRRRYYGKTAWTGMHLDWIRKQVFEAHNRVLVDDVPAVRRATGTCSRDRVLTVLL